MANELRILRHVRHPNVVLFYGACLDVESGGLALVMELVLGECLDAFVDKLDRGGEATLSLHRVVLRLCRGLSYLHALNPVAIHGDLKPSSVMVGTHAIELRVKILDFGLS